MTRISAFLVKELDGETLSTTFPPPRQKSSFAYLGTWGVNLTVHDLVTESDLAEHLEARRLRAERYAREMPVTDQLDAILKAFNPATPETAPG